MEKPKLITPTRTRKYISTIMQLLDITEGELTWITNHMGHTNDIHRGWYRKEDSMVELTKVAKVLMAVDCGQSEDLKNKKIHNLTLQGICYLYPNLASLLRGEGVGSRSILGF